MMQRRTASSVIRRLLPPGILLLMILSGCAGEQTHEEYQAFGAVVRALDLESGEIFVRAERPVEGWRADRDIPCVVTKDSELYVNDRFSQLHELRVGDRLELVGYRDKDHLVAVLIHAAQPEPPPPPPDMLLAPASQPRP